MRRLLLPTAGSQFRSCAPRRRNGEIRIGLAGLEPIAFVDRATAKQAALDQPRDCSEQSARSLRNRLCSSELAAGERWADQCRTAARNILDRAEQEVVNRLGKAGFARQRVGF